MVVSGDDVIDGVRSRLIAEVADSLIALEDDESSCLPVFRKSSFACRCLPRFLVLVASSLTCCVFSALRFDARCWSEHEVRVAVSLVSRSIRLSLYAVLYGLSWRRGEGISLFRLETDDCAREEGTVLVDPG